MTIANIQPQQKNSRTKTIIIYVIAILAVGALVFFGGELLKSLNLLKGKAALRVETQNGKAQVFVNESFVGETPLDSTEITPGQNKITIKAQDREYETNIDFLAKVNKSAHIVAIIRDLGVSDVFSSGYNVWFEKDNGSGVLKIVSEPKEAKVYVDNTEIGQTPFSSTALTPGEYDIKIEKPGFEMASVRVKVEKGYTSMLDVELFPLPTSAIVNRFEGSENLYSLITDNQQVSANTNDWAKAVIYWNKTRGINLDNTGNNTQLVFDFYIDYWGNIFNQNGVQVVSSEQLETLKDVKRGAYLGRQSDGPGLTVAGKEALEKIGKSEATRSKVKILDTGMGWLRVRDAASTSGAEIAKVDVGKTFPFIEEKAGWVKIRLPDGKEGWVSKTYVEINE